MFNPCKHIEELIKSGFSEDQALAIIEVSMKLFSDYKNKRNIYKPEAVLEQLYNLIEQKHGKVEAKKSVSDIVYICLSRLQDQQLPICGENLSLTLWEFVKDFKEATSDKKL